MQQAIYKLERSKAHETEYEPNDTMKIAKSRHDAMKQRKSNRTNMVPYIH